MCPGFFPPAGLELLLRQVSANIDRGKAAEHGATAARSGDGSSLLSREAVMDWNVVASTFAVIFLAEVGDKTQLATLALASGSQSRAGVFLGAAAALVAASLLAVLMGTEVARWVPQVYLRRGAGLIFMVLGVLYLFGGD